MHNTKLPVLLVPSSSSTMDIMKARWFSMMPMAVVCCLEQTSGRGRFGNTWISSHGESLMMTYPYQAACPMNVKLPFTAALAVHDFIHQTTGLRSQFLWPNDIVFDRRKLAGILIEQIGSGCYSVGVGVNLHQHDWPSELVSRAVSLKQLGIDLQEDNLTLCHRLSENLMTRLQWAESLSESQVIECWNAYSCTAGVQYTLPGGEMVTATGVDNLGHLLIQRSGRPEAISSAVPLHKTWMTGKNLDQDTGDSDDR
ncbi:MAG: biotin--[acetyl-CoA-carboxylase] ligase [Armatimonadota bacterium]